MKSLLTQAIERGALRHFAKLGTFLCPEVGITTIEDIPSQQLLPNGEPRYVYHKRNTEIVDILSWDTKDMWYCYEIKISKSDFYSKAKKTFIGNYNYYIMPQNLYALVKNDIPNDIGVYIIDDSKFDDKTIRLEPRIIKKAKRRDLGVDKDILLYSMIKSLYRDTENYERRKPRYTFNEYETKLERKNASLKRDNNDLKKQRDELYQKLRDKEYCSHCEELKFQLNLAKKRIERLIKND